MNAELVDKIAEAVLYEGYVLYPYRPCVKSRCRWTFGGIYPRAFVEVNPGSDAAEMQTQCIVCGSADTTLYVRVRFLHQMTRTARPSGDTWQEATERQIRLNPVQLRELCDASQTQTFTFPSTISEEAIVLRQQQAICGGIELSAQQLAAGIFRVTARIENQTEMAPADVLDRDKAVMRSLASTHAILNVTDGAFVSLTDPPEPLAPLAAGCKNVGCWPVLVGDPGETDTLLASPIILYDYPQIAPESPGDLFDGTEIDEILSLRILTLTDEEKRQAAATDERVRRMLARTESLGPEQLASLHGTIRGLRPVTTEERHA